VTAPTAPLASALRLSALDEDLLRIETTARPMHWCFLVQLAPGRRVNLAALRERVAARAASRTVFSLTVSPNRFRAPRVGVDPRPIDREAMVRHLQVHGDAQLRLRLADMMARFAPTDRLWELTLVDDVADGRQYLVVRVHHCLGDGLSASGFAYLFVDGTDDELAQFDRYLVSPRFVLPPVGGGELREAWRHLAHTWMRGHRGQRPPARRPSPTRLVHHMTLPAAAVNAAARSHRATQTEFLLASVTLSVRATLPPGPTTMRTMIPMTLDAALRHTGNAMAFALVNLPLTLESFDDVLADLHQQVAEIAARRPHVALPTLTQSASGPWPYKTWASRAVMTAVRPDLDVGLTPLHLTIDRVLGADVEAVLPFSPLVYTPISVAALLLGGRLSLGVTTDAATTGALGEALVDELTTRLVASRAAAAPVPA
jgi:hypothetical protein